MWGRQSPLPTSCRDIQQHSAKISKDLARIAGWLCRRLIRPRCERVSRALRRPIWLDRSPARRRISGRSRLAVREAGMGLYGVLAVGFRSHLGGSVSVRRIPHRSDNGLEHRPAYRPKRQNGGTRGGIGQSPQQRAFDRPDWRLSGLLPCLTPPILHGPLVCLHSPT